MFVRSIDRKERMAIGIKLKDNDSANGLTEDWVEVKRVCRRHDEKRTRTLSTTTWPTSGGQKRVTSDDRLPPNNTSRVEEGSRTRLLETSGDEGVSIIEACMIEEDKGCEAYRLIKRCL